VIPERLSTAELWGETFKKWLLKIAAVALRSSKWFAPDLLLRESSASAQEGPDTGVKRTGTLPPGIRRRPDGLYPCGHGADIDIRGRAVLSKWRCAAAVANKPTRRWVRRGGLLRGWSSVEKGAGRARPSSGDSDRLVDCNSHRR